jgi:hypothetical protein
LLLIIDRFLLLLVEKYDIVGRLLKPGEKATIYPLEENSIDGGDTIGMKKLE